MDFQKENAATRNFGIPKRLYDEKYCEKWKVAGRRFKPSGNLFYSPRRWIKDGGWFRSCFRWMLRFFLNCDIIDLPGYGTETASDDVITAKTAAHADVLIYSIAGKWFLEN